LTRIEKAEALLLASPPSRAWPEGIVPK